MTRTLSDKTRMILSLIAEGHSYSQIVDGNVDITYPDIFHAAEEALRLNESESDYAKRMVEIKKKYPRAYERWTTTEEKQLKQLFEDGLPTIEIAKRLQRQPSAIRSRVSKIDSRDMTEEPGEMKTATD